MSFQLASSSFDHPSIATDMRPFQNWDIKRLINLNMSLNMHQLNYQEKEKK